MALLDVVIDPLAVRGERWFLGHLFTYPEGGVYFGVPLSNFGGWLLVGWATVGGYVWLAGDRRPGSPRMGIALYYLVLMVNLAVTLWIGEFLIAAAGIVVHGRVFLLLYNLSRVPCSADGRPERLSVNPLKAERVRDLWAFRCLRCGRWRRTCCARSWRGASAIPSF